MALLQREPLGYLGLRMSSEIDFMVLGNGWPDSKQIAQSESKHIRVYLLVGSMELTLELAFCAT